MANKEVEILQFNNEVFDIVDKQARQQLDNIANKGTKKQKVLFPLKRIVKLLAPYLADLLFQLLIEFLKHKLGL